jgi:hypothetical protein
MENKEPITLEELLSGDHNKTLSISGVQDAMQLAERLPLTYTTLQKGVHVFRARAHSASKRFYFPRDISYKTDLDSVKMGRANDKGKSMFYASCRSGPLPQALLTVCMETSKLLRDQKKGYQTFTVGVWKVKKPIELPILHALRPKGFDPKSAAARDELEQMRMALPEDIRNKVNRLHELLSREFGKRVPSGAAPETYMVSAAFADMVYKMKHHGLAYPSVETEEMGQNIALTPWAAEKWLQPVGAQLVQFHMESDQQIFVCQYDTAFGKQIPWSWTHLHPGYALNRPFITEDQA